MRSFSFFKKFTVFLIAVGLFISALNLRAQAPKSQEEEPDFVEARRLFWAGQYREADAKFRLFLATHPNHETTQSFLKMIAQSKLYDPEKIKQTKAHLESVKIAKVDFRKADWRAAFSYIQEQVNAPQKDAGASKRSVNFIYMLPSNFSAEINLNMKDISAWEAIEYSCKAAGLRAVVDTWAVIIDVPKTGK